MSAALFLYRARTVGLLRRYFRMSIELGRLPALLGREFFRAKVTSYRMSTFEDAVIFVHDVERCLERLDEASRQLIARIALQEYTQTEAAPLLGKSLRTVQRQYPEALDRLSAIFLQSALLTEIEYVVEEPAQCGTGLRPIPEIGRVTDPPHKAKGPERSCQEAESQAVAATA